MYWTRQRVVGSLLLFSAGSAAAAVYTLVADSEPVRPAAGGDQSGTGTVLGGTPQAPSPEEPAGVFTISGRVAGLLPGRVSSLPLRVTNPNDFPIQVLTLDTAVAEPAGCPTGSLSVARYEHADGTAAVTAPPNGSVEVPVTVRYADSPTADQSGCAGRSFALSFTGTAVDAR